MGNMMGCRTRGKERRRNETNDETDSKTTTITAWSVLPKRFGFLRVRNRRKYRHEANTIVFAPCGRTTKISKNKGRGQKEEEKEKEEEEEE